MKREANSEGSGESWLPELSFSTVLTVVGIGLTAIDLFFRFYTSKTEKGNYDLTPVHMTVKTSPEPAPQQKSCAPPRIGVAEKVIQQFIKKNVSTK